MRATWTNHQEVICELRVIRDMLADMQRKDKVIATMRAALLAVLEPDGDTPEQVLEQVQAAIKLGAT